MGVKLMDYGDNCEGYRLLGFHCPGCGYDHGFAVATANPTTRPLWGWNGSMTSPTFTPSLLCNKDSAPNRCHSFVTEGKIQFLTDCFHSLAGQTVEIPDFEGWDSMESRARNIRGGK